MQSHQKKLKEEIKEQKEELTRLIQTNEVETAIYVIREYFFGATNYRASFS